MGDERTSRETDAGPAARVRTGPRRAAGILAVVRACWPALLGWSVLFGRALILWSIDNGRMGPAAASRMVDVVWVTLGVCTLGTFALAPRVQEAKGCVLVALNMSALVALLFAAIIV